MDVLLLPGHDRLLTELALDKFVTSLASLSLHSSHNLCITLLMPLSASLSSHFSPWSTFCPSFALCHLTALSLSPTHDVMPLFMPTSLLQPQQTKINYTRILLLTVNTGRYLKKSVRISLFFLHLWSLPPSSAPHLAVIQHLLSCLIMWGYKRS